VDENRRVWPGDPARGEIEIVEERVVWENAVARLYDDRVRLPSRDARAERIVPIAPDDRVLLVRQFRHPVRMWLRELPRGAGAEGEVPEDGARRELREELGCGVRELFPLGRVVTDSGQLTGIPHLFAARVVEEAAPEREEGESIDRVYRMRFTERAEACARGDIVDAFTLAAVLRVAPHFDGDRFAWRADAAARDPLR
jgi:ADP-ribose pyrophosphatase